MSLKSRLKQALESAGENRTTLARAIGVSPQAVQKWITEGEGATEPRRGKIPAICAHLGVSETWLLTGMGDMHPPKKNKSELIKEISTGLDELSLDALNEIYRNIKNLP